MKFGRTDRNFGVLEHKVYPPEPGVTKRLAQHSSAIDLEDCGKPGSSFLWIGDDFHLNRGK